MIIAELELIKIIDNPFHVVLYIFVHLNNQIRGSTSLGAGDPLRDVINVQIQVYR